MRSFASSVTRRHRHHQIPSDTCNVVSFAEIQYVSILIKCSLREYSLSLSMSFSRIEWMNQTIQIETVNEIWRSGLGVCSQTDEEWIKKKKKKRCQSDWCWNNHHVHHRSWGDDRACVRLLYCLCRSAASRELIGSFKDAPSIDDSKWLCQEDSSTCTSSTRCVLCKSPFNKWMQNTMKWCGGVEFHWDRMATKLRSNRYRLSAFNLTVFLCAIEWTRGHGTFQTRMARSQTIGSLANDNTYQLQQTKSIKTNHRILYGRHCQTSVHFFHSQFVCWLMTRATWTGWIVRCIQLES